MKKNGGVIFRATVPLKGLAVKNNSAIFPLLLSKKGSTISASLKGL